MDNPLLIQTPHALLEACDRLRREPRLAVDTESNSLFAYRERVCLLQFSTPSEDLLLDPLALPDLSPLGPILADPACEKVFHAAEYDLICLRRDFGFRLAHIFDTMVAARALGEDGTGLGALLRKELGIELDKRFQRANWGVRPLPANQLEYARLDTHHLLGLRTRLEPRLREAGLWEEAQEDFRRVAEHSIPAPEAPREAGLWKVKGVFDLPRAERAVLLPLYLFREAEAERLDRPPFKILSDETLVAIAKANPTGLAELSDVPGLSPANLQRWGSALVAAVRHASAAQLPAPPPSNAASEIVRARHEALRKWRKQRAAKRGVESDVILNRDALWQIAQRDPGTLSDLQAIPGLGPHRLAKYGHEILQVLTQARVEKKSHEN
ncbi:MAG: HRDC domain-containing protein [Chloroflexi bacterium]|nr:HRDC domain-containing protein [Chloroflexota bacterium]